MLGFGETIDLREGVAIEFVDVEEDSRCPNNLVCVQDGNARILVSGHDPARSPAGPAQYAPGLPQSALFDYYGVSLRKLEHPVHDAQTGSSQIPDSNEATFFVVKAAEPP